MGNTNQKKSEPPRPQKQSELNLEILSPLALREFLQQQNCTRAILDVCERYQLDGEALLLNTELFAFLAQQLVNAEQQPLADKLTLSEQLSNMLREHADKYRTLYTRPIHNPGFQPHEGLHEAVASGDGFTLSLFYHDRSINDPKQPARNGKREWALQPRTHRRYYGAEYARLPIPGRDFDASLPSILDVETLLSCSAAIESIPLSVSSFSSFIFHSLALTGRKNSLQNKISPRAAWTKRVNASSGGLHPTECYFILPSVEFGFSCTSASVLHYHAPYHGVERLRSFSERTWAKLAAGLPSGSFFAVVTCVAWREIWKYGERALRYTLLDGGHAIAALFLSARLHGWSVHVLPVAEQLIAEAIGLNLNENEAERERVQVMLAVVPQHDELRLPLPLKALKRISKSEFIGVPNTLSFTHTNWEIVDATWDTLQSDSATEVRLPSWRDAVELNSTSSNKTPIAQLIRERRSATAFNKKAVLPRSTFDRLLTLLSHNSLASLNFPFASQPLWQCNVSVWLFVARVDGIEPGVYSIEPNRAGDANGEIGTTLVRSFDADSLSNTAQLASCQQALAMDCCVTLVMTAPIPKEHVTQYGSCYKAIHLQSGFIGQLCYNAMQTDGFACTAMGCFTDQFALHALGLPENECMDLFHMAIGEAVPDTRYIPYSHEKDVLDIVD
jgi:hypothetical protein